MSEPAAPGARRRRLAVAAVALLGAALYVPSLGGEFLNWDDGWIVVENPHLEDADGLRRILDPTGWRASLGAEYLPVRDLSFWVDRRLWGLDPFGYRLVNALLYGLICGLAVPVLRVLTGSTRAALLGALVFAVHPTHVETVAWVSERKGLLAALFLMAALLLYRRARERSSPGAYVGAVLVFVLAALSKSTVHFFALLLPGLEWIESRRAGRRARPLRWAALAAPFLLVSLAAIVVNARHQAEVGAAYGWGLDDVQTAAATVGETAFRGAALLLFPVGLSAEHELLGGVAGGLAAVLVAIGLVAVGLAVRRGRRVAPPALFAVLAWLPVSNLVALPNPMAERYLFLVSLGAAGLAGLGLDALRPRRPVVLGGIVVTVVGLAALTVAREKVWTDRLALWTDAVAKAPRSARAHQNLGEARLARGDVPGAFTSFHRMLQVEPEEGAWYVFVADKHVAAGDPEGATRILQEGMRRVPSDPLPRVKLAQLLLERVSRHPAARGLERDAERLLLEVAGDPDERHAGLRAIARYTLGVIELRRGRLERGIALTRQALDEGLSPSDEVQARRNLVQALGLAGRAEEAAAEEAILRALLDRLGPDAPGGAR